MTILYTCLQFSGHIFDWATLFPPSTNMPFKYDMYFMMTYQLAKGFVGTRWGYNVQKIVFCFLICTIQKGAILAPPPPSPKRRHTCIKMGTKIQYAKTLTDSELTYDG